MNLERLLTGKRLKELQEICAFWNGEAPLPRTKDDAVHELIRALGEEVTIRSRMRHLSKKLVDLLGFILKGRDYTVPLYSLLHNAESLQLNPYEIEAALSALSKRGFVFPFKDRSWAHYGGAAYAVPREMGDILKRILGTIEEDPARRFTVREAARERGLGRTSPALKRLLTAEGRERVASGEDLTDVLASREEALHRVGRLRVRGLESLCREVASRFGGIVSRSVFEKAFRGQHRWPGPRERRALADALVGRVGPLSLGEYGIRLAEEALVLYGAVSDALLRSLPPREETKLDVWKTLGVDLLSDLTTLFYAIKNNRLRVTQAGEIYRSSVKRLLGSLLSNNKGDFEEDEVFQFLLQFSYAAKLIRKGPDRQLLLTPKGTEWESLPVEQKIRDLLRYAIEERGLGGEYFHQVRLRRILLERMRATRPGLALDTLALPYLARNAYFRRLRTYQVREFFQNRFQYVQDSPLEDPVEMAANLLTWMRRRLYLLGLVELGTGGGKVVAARVSPLGARVLGFRASSATAQATGGSLVVNPDFEVLLFPDEGDPGLVYSVDRFAQRVKSDRIYQYRITATSIERAIVEGMTAAEILAVLSEKSRTEVPQNVIYSIRSWSEKVKAVRLQTCTILRAESREVLDRLQNQKKLKGMIEERLSPTVLVLRPDVDVSALQEILGKKGILVRENREGS